MILEDATHEAYGYYPSALSHGSHKRILAACDDCNKIRVTSKHSYRALCHPCTMIGGKATDEHKRKNSEAHKGKTGYWLGKSHTAKTKQKMSDAQKGKEFSEEHKSNLSKSKEGENNFNFGKFGEEASAWKGGKSFEPYCIKFNKDYKRKIREQFSNKCFLCGKTEAKLGRALDVHHVNYNKDCGCDSTLCICVPLCHSCHMKTNSRREYWQELIIIKLKNTLAGR